MENNCIIARRRQDGIIQYGRCGNGGYLANVAFTLLSWYDDPVMVDYLFGIGQIDHLGIPFSEKRAKRECYLDDTITIQTGEKYGEADSERCIFSKTAPVDRGYLYDWDGKWYYIDPQPVRIKIPLDFMYRKLYKTDDLTDYLMRINHMVATHIVRQYPKIDPGFAALMKKYDRCAIIQSIDASDWPIQVLYENYRDLFHYLDDWAVIILDAEQKKVASIQIRKAENPRTETIDWPVCPARLERPQQGAFVTGYARDYVKGYLLGMLKMQCKVKNSQNPAVPEWFVRQFSATLGDEMEACRLIDEWWDVLLDESEYLRNTFDIGLEKGKKYYLEQTELRLSQL